MLLTQMLRSVRRRLVKRVGFRLSKVIRTIDGLVMGTRCGTIDPGVVLYLMDQHGMDARAVGHDLLSGFGQVRAVAPGGV